MKVALVLTGLLRCFEQAYPSFKTNFLDLYDVDVFFNIWSEVGFYSGKGYTHQPSDHFISTREGERGFFDSGELIDYKRIVELYNPVSIEIEDFSKFEPTAEKRKDYFQNAFTRPKNTISQFYKQQKGAMQLMSYSEATGANYDMVVRARPDISIDAEIGVLDPKKFYTLPSRNKYGRGTGDSIFIGSFDAILQFSTIYSRLEEIYDILGYSDPHEFCSFYIQQMGVDWTELNVPAHVAHSPKGVYQEPV